MSKVVSMAARRHVRLGPKDLLRRRRTDGLLDTAMFDAMDQMIWIARTEGTIEFVNAAGRAGFRLSAHATHTSWLDLVHPDDRPALCSAWQESRVAGKSFSAQARLESSSGGWRWLLVQLSPALSDDAMDMYWIGTATDIQSLKDAEYRQALIARELAHRIRNFFSVASSLVMLSAGADSDWRSLANAIRARLDALALAHAYLLADGDSEPPSLHGLLAVLLAPHQVGGRARFEIAGDDIAMGRDAVTSLCLLFHELATNAVKHGALSVEQGHVRVATRVSNATIEVDWEETGGPVIVGPPRHAGFGSTIAARALPASRGGIVRNEWRPEGLRVRIAIPPALMSA